MANGGGRHLGGSPRRGPGAKDGARGRRHGDRGGPGQPEAYPAGGFPGRGRGALVPPPQVSRVREVLHVQDMVDMLFVLGRRRRDVGGRVAPVLKPVLKPVLEPVLGSLVAAGQPDLLDGEAAIRGIRSAGNQDAWWASPA